MCSCVQLCAAVCSCVQLCVVVYLVSDEVLLVAGVAAQHSQAVPTQQVFGVGVKLLKVSPEVRVEGRPEATHLRTHTHTHYM